MRSAPIAHVGGMWASGLVEVSDDAHAIERGGRWVVALPYDGAPTFARFSQWSQEAPPGDLGTWGGVGPWSSSMDQAAYVTGVRTIQQRIESGEVYQVNLCRVLTAECSGDIAGLYTRIADVHGAPHSSLISIPECGLRIASASPELFLRRRGTTLLTSPIKGTATSRNGFLDKDTAENIMIVDLMRNDLAKVARTGTVFARQLLRTEHHPGLVHLVSDVECELDPLATWPDILMATFPPGSVTGAPKSSAVRIIRECEPVSREIYCGALGWIDADRDEGCLAVAIRTFWQREGLIKFGTGAGITWGSDPVTEWHETQLKADRLCGIANGSVPTGVLAEAT